MATYAIGDVQGRTLEADQMQAWTGHRRGESLHEFQRRHDDVGGAVAVWAFELQHYLAGKLQAIR